MCVSVCTFTTQIKNALVAQWIAHWTSNPEVAGLNPVKSAVDSSNELLFFLCVCEHIYITTQNK